MSRRILKPALAALLLSAAVASPAALAGRYHVYSCRTPSGAVAPVDGWSGSKTGTYTYITNSCAEPNGSLLAALGDEPIRAANTDSAKWEFSAPSGTTLTAATLWRAGDADGGGGINANYGVWFTAPLNKNDPADVFAECAAGIECPTGYGDTTTPLASANRIVVPSSKLAQHLYAEAACFGQPEFECPAGKGDANGYAAALYLYAADLTLEQTGGPMVSAVGGELSSAPVIAGTSDLTFNATDPGAGVYEMVLTVDGTVVQRTVINEAGGRCRDVGQTTDGLPAFLYLQPCPASVSADLPFNTAGLVNGPHHLTVAVTDAAGNWAPVLNRTVTVANPVAPGAPAAPGPANGLGASSAARLEVRWKCTTKPLLKGVYGHARFILGRLLDSQGKPIVGALIEASRTAAYTGAKSVAIKGPRTGSDGRFSLQLPANTASQTVQISYRAHLGDATAAAGRTLKVELQAGVSLTVNPRVSGAGRTIYFNGRLLGGPIPAGGKPVVLEARAGTSGWIEFKVVRSGSQGRFHASYRFRFPGPVRYQFRALCEHEADYPYATGASGPVNVYER